MTIEDRQYQAWGVVVQNANLKSAHLANGVVQTLRALPTLVAEPPEWSDSEVPRRFDKAVKAALESALGPVEWRLSRAAISLAVTKSKSGVTLLTRETDPTTSDDRAIIEAGLAHLGEVFAGDSPRLSRRQHELLAGALNADGTVYVTGGADPTTPGLCLGGYSSTHTLKLMHAATFLGALAHGGEPGCRVLSKLHSLLADERDTHSRLVKALRVGGSPISGPLEPSPRFSRALPFPTGPEWAGFPELVVELTSRLLQWTRDGGSKQEVMMSLVDLAGLLLVLRMLDASTAEGHGLLVVCPTGRTSTGRYAVEAARRTLRAAQYRIDRSADERGLVKLAKGGKWTPSRAARTLALATGWLFPLYAQGGAVHHFSPGARQLVTLCQCLMEPGEDLDWYALHQRALELGLVLGGAEESRSAGYVGALCSREAVRRAGAINQAYMIDLGLARRESDGVVRVTGGA